VGPWSRAGLSLAVVGAALFLFLSPRSLFISATFAATTVMAACAWAGGAFAGDWRPKRSSLLLGALSAASLYALFYAGNAGVSAFAPAQKSSANQIYDLIASPSNPLFLQLLVLAFDSVGYESYFRGVLQRDLTPRLGLWAIPGVAAFDAALHLATLNPLWVATTFVADLVWGLTYRGRGLWASGSSHFLWDVAIFVLAPIR
jgi:Type II CAAX prenyl endopeptidase Rce1-like